MFIKVTLTTLLLALVLSSGAQNFPWQVMCSHLHISHPEYYRMSQLINLYNSSYKTARSTEKTTAAGSRIVGVAALTYDGALFVNTDSAALYYSGMRGAGPRNSWKFDSSIAYRKETEYEKKQKVTQLFDLNDNLIKLTRYTYDSAVGVWDSVTRALVSYDISNNPIRTINQLWNSSTMMWTSTGRDTETYNSSNQVLTDLQLSFGSGWDTNSLALFSYTPSGLLDTSTYKTMGYMGSDYTLVDNYRYIYLYNPGGLVDTIIDQVFNTLTSAWENEELELSEYNSSGDLTTYTELRWNSASGEWANFEKVTYRDFAESNPQTEVYQLWDTISSTWADKYAKLLSYNSFGQPLTLEQVSWDSTTDTFELHVDDLLNRYYYEDYSLGLKNVSDLADETIIYPVPAKNCLQVIARWREPQAYTIRMYDMRGKCVVVKMVPYSNVPLCSSILLSDLPSGVYLVSIEGTKTTFTRELTISK